MSDASIDDIKIAKAMLMTFAQNGFKKTSMEGLGRAAGVSRQSIYKRFKSKEICYEWTIHTYLSDMYLRIFSTLSDEKDTPLDTLISVFDILIGEAVEIINTPHGTATLDDVLKTTRTSNEDWPLRFRARLASFLIRHDYALAETAEGTAYALIAASKGLLLEEASRENFLKNMTVIIKSVIRYGS